MFQADGKATCKLNQWAAKRCPNNVGANPARTTAGVYLTDGQTATREFVYV